MSLMVVSSLQRCWITSSAFTVSIPPSTCAWFGFGLPARALVWIVTTERCDTFWNTYFTATGVRPRRSRRRRRAERNAELCGEAVSLDE